MSGGITAKEIELIHRLIAEIRRLWKLYGSVVVHAKDVAYCKNLLKKANGELHTAEAVYGRTLTLSLRMKCRSCKQRLDNFREFWAFWLFPESQSHFERSERVKGFVKISPRRRHPELCRARRIVLRTRRGMHFAVITDELDLSSTQRRLEKDNFDCAVNKLLDVTPTVRDKCAHSHLIFDLATFLCFTRVSEA